MTFNARSPRAQLVFLLVALCVCIASVLFFQGVFKSASIPAPLSVEELIKKGIVLFDDQETKAMSQFWPSEIMARKHGEIIELLWDSLNHTTNRFDVLNQFSIGKIVFPHYDTPLSLPHDISLWKASGSEARLSDTEWRQWLETQRRDGWKIGDLEFRHNQFDPAKGSSPATSVYYFAAQLTNSTTGTRLILEGDLHVIWGASANPTAVDASRVEMRSRPNLPAFRPVLSAEIQPPRGSFFIDPLIVEDIDGDGALEILLVSANKIFHGLSNDQWQATDLCVHAPSLIFTACLADFNSDGALDLLCADAGGLLLWEGDASGQFPNPPRRVWKSSSPLQYVQVLAFGDIDKNGSLDVFLGQYKPPYAKGQMPTPYFSANDGYPSYMLVNDGHGNFADATRQSGFITKRNRRVYSASLVDLDDDGDLDLLVVSDFAGLESWQNDGTGHFSENTAALFPEPYGFGMSHTFADFNGDGKMDVLMVGMSSPTAERLDHLRLSRPYPQGDSGMRAKMTYGNRLWMGRTTSMGFAQTTLNLPIRKTGWSWAAAAADFDGDGFPDLYITNGHETRESVKDYESEFWLHDIYMANSADDVMNQQYFVEKYRRTRGQGQSYGGYERTRFFLNLGGTNFTEAAHLCGLGVAEDCRSAVAADINNDGKMDLILTTFEAFPQARQTLQVVLNELNTDHGGMARSQSNSAKPTKRFDKDSLSGYRSQGPSYHRSKQKLQLH